MSPSEPQELSQELRGWTILIPRTPEQAAPMVTQLQARGAEICLFPTIAIRPPHDPEELDAGVEKAVQGQYQWIIFTSHNAVEAVAQSSQYDPEKILRSGTRIAAVGKATAQSLERHHLPVHLSPPPDQRRASGLLSAFAPLVSENETARTILIPRADIAKADLVQGLEEQGWEVEAVTAYRTTSADPPSAHTLSELSRVNLICFTSGSTLRNYCSLVGVPGPEVIIACIGPVAAAEAHKYGLTVHIMPEHSGIPELVEAIAEYARHYPCPRKDS